MTKSDWNWITTSLGGVLVLIGMLGWSAYHSEKRLDAIERTTNVLMQWSAYRAWTNATFTSIERTNAAVLH